MVLWAWNRIGQSVSDMHESVRHTPLGRSTVVSWHLGSCHSMCEASAKLPPCQCVPPTRHRLPRWLHALHLDPDIGIRLSAFSSISPPMHLVVFVICLHFNLAYIMLSVPTASLYIRLNIFPFSLWWQQLDVEKRADERYQ